MKQVLVFLKEHNFKENNNNNNNNYNNNNSPYLKSLLKKKIVLNLRIFKEINLHY